MPKIVIIFLYISLNICFWCSKEPSHRDRSFEYPQHMFWLRNKKNNFQLPTLIWGPDDIFLTPNHSRMTSCHAFRLSNTRLFLIISTVILLLPLIYSRRVVVSYKRKYVHKLLVNRLLKPAQEKCG